jgi:hypothetical protein
MSILLRESSEEKKTIEAFVPSKFLLSENQVIKLGESQLLFKAEKSRACIFLHFNSVSARCLFGKKQMDKQGWMLEFKA